MGANGRAKQVHWDASSRETAGRGAASEGAAGSEEWLAAEEGGKVEEAAE